MFNFFKKKDKENKGNVSTATDNGWGSPVTNRKMSKDEAARDAAEQKIIEEKNLERRNTYRHAGVERIFNDLDGRRLALRTEIDEGVAPDMYPPLVVIAFWGVKEIGHLHATLETNMLRITDCRTEFGFSGRGISAELLREAEEFARQKGLREVCCPPAVETVSDWNSAFYNQAGYSPRGNTLVKGL